MPPKPEFATYSVATKAAGENLREAYKALAKDTDFAIEQAELAVERLKEAKAAKQRIGQKAAA